MVKTKKDTSKRKAVTARHARTKSRKTSKSQPVATRKGLGFHPRAGLVALGLTLFALVGSLTILYSEAANTQNASPKTASFRVATFNVLKHEATIPGKPAAKEGWKGSDVRLTAAMAKITGQKYMLVGLQEFSREQHDFFNTKYLASWGVFPAQPAAPNPIFQGPDSAIIWRKDTFSLVEGGQRVGELYQGLKRDSQWALLKHTATGKTFYVTSTHDPTTNKNLGNNVAARIANARANLAFSEPLIAKAPLISLGDFNSSFSLRPKSDIGISNPTDLTYCILTSTRKLANAFDVSSGGKKPKFSKVPRQNIKPCPSTGKMKKSVIDHIYVSDKVTVHKWHHGGGMIQEKISNHNPTWAYITIN